MTQATFTYCKYSENRSRAEFIRARLRCILYYTNIIKAVCNPKVYFGNCGSAIHYLSANFVQTERVNELASLRQNYAANIA